MDTEPSEPAASDRKPRGVRFTIPSWVAFVLIVVSGLLAYGVSLNADFYMDDYPHIVDNEFLKGERSELPGEFRHFSYAVYSVLYALFGPSPFAFHLLNLLIHLGAACGLFACGRVLLRRLGLLSGEDARSFAAFAGALLFVAHPFASEAVNYARCSMIGFVTLFTILSTWAALRWGERPGSLYGTLFVTFFLLGTLSKEVGVFHIAFNAALVVWVAAERGWVEFIARAFNGPHRTLLRSLAALAAIPFAYLVYRFAAIAIHKASSPQILDHILTQGRVIWGYFANMVFPRGLLADHQIAWTRSLGDVPALVGTFAMFAVGAGAVFLVVHKRTRPVGVLVAMLMFPLYLRLLYPMFEHFVEYRAYPALPWFGLIAGLGLALLAGLNWRASQWALAALVLAGATASAMRSAAWSDANTLAYQSIDKYPFNNRARTILQAAAYREGEYGEVMNLRRQIHAVYQTTIDYNSSNRWGREYDLGRANYDLTNCEQLTAYAIAEVHGSEKALEFIESRLALFREQFGPFESEEEYRFTMGSLLTAREVLTEHGEEYDRQRGHVASAPSEEP